MGLQEARFTWPGTVGRSFLEDEIVKEAVNADALCGFRAGDTAQSPGGVWRPGAHCLSGVNEQQDVLGFGGGTWLDLHILSVLLIERRKLLKTFSASFFYFNSLCAP